MLFFFYIFYFFFASRSLREISKERIDFDGELFLLWFIVIVIDRISLKKTHGILQLLFPEINNIQALESIIFKSFLYCSMIDSARIKHCRPKTDGELF